MPKSGLRCLNRGKKSEPLVKDRTSDTARRDGRTFAFRFGCGNRDADFLRAGGSQSVVHSGIRWRVRSGIALWIPTGRVALWRD